MKKYRNSIIKGIRALVFLLIAGVLFVLFTYVFRNLNSNGRKMIASFYSERKDSLDMVMVGNSRVYRTWNPMIAWNEEGVASRNYAVAHMHEAAYLSAVKDIIKNQHPKIIVAEINPFLSSQRTEGITPGTRRYLDSLDVGIDRLKAVHYFVQKNDIKFEKALSLYIDLINYHENTYALWSKAHWKLADNRVTRRDLPRNFFKGHYATSNVEALPDEAQLLTDERAPLEPLAEELYRELLLWCAENDIVIVPIAIPPLKDSLDAMQINEIAAISEEYGIPFIDLNRYTEQAGIDFSEDFENQAHLNAMGAIKATRFLLELLQEYELPDHRGEEAYVSWDEEWDRYVPIKAIQMEKLAFNRLALNDPGVNANDDQN